MDELCESLYQLLFIQPLGEKKPEMMLNTLKASIHLWEVHSNIIKRAYMQDFLPQRGGLHTTDEAKQQVHHGRGINMFQHQTNEAFLFL